MTTETARAFYRRQEWNPGYGHKVKALGRLVTVMVDGKERVDVDASIARYEATRDPAKAYMMEVNKGQRARRRATQEQGGRAPDVPDIPQQSVDAKSTTYLQAKTVREVYEAKNAKLAYEERIGKLLPADQVKSHLAARVASMREAFLQIPSRLVPILVAESDADKIRELLEEEIARAMALVSGA